MEFEFNKEVGIGIARALLRKLHTEESPLRKILGMEKIKPKDPVLRYVDNDVVWGMASEGDWLAAKPAITRNDVWMDRPEFFKFLSDFEKFVAHRVMEEAAHNLSVASKHIIGTTEYYQGYRSALQTAEQTLLDNIYEQQGTSTAQTGDQGRDL